MGTPARVTSIEAGRITEGRTLYGTAQGKQKETYLGIPYSLLPRLYESSLAEVRMQIYVWQRTGGWKDYHAHPQPARITFAEWTDGREGYAQDAGAHLCTQEISTTRDALVAKGWLYEEWETPHVRGPRRYALIAPSNPGIGPYQREDGTWEVLLMTDEGPQPYQIPEAVLQHRKAGEILLQHRKETLLQDRKDSSITSKSALLEHRKEKSQRAFPRQGQREPITNTLANYSTKQELAKRAADAAPTPGAKEEDKSGAEKHQPPNPSLPSGSEDTTHSGIEATPPTAEFLSKPSLFPAVAMPASVPVEEAFTPPKRSRTRGVKERKPRSPNPMYEVWKRHISTPPGSAREITSICTGLAELANPALTEGRPVTLEELPALMYQAMSWVDRVTGEHYTPTPRLIATYLSRLRDQIITCPAPKVRAWLAGYLPSPEEAPEAQEDQAEEHTEAQADQTVGTPLPDPDDLLTELVTDPAWITRLSRFVPDAEGARDGSSRREVQMLWGFVRDALRPGLNIARRQHLDSLVPAWNPINPRELVLLGSTSYTIRFANMALLREINELVGKLLSRFFEHARLALVRQEVIEQLQHSINDAG